MITSRSGLFGVDVFHGFTIRDDSDLCFREMNEGSFQDMQTLGVGGVAWANQIHGDGFCFASSSGEQGDFDALITSTRGLGLVIRTADCVPVLVSNGVEVAAIHAGWRGAFKGIIEKVRKDGFMRLNLQLLHRIM